MYKRTIRRIEFKEKELGEEWWYYTNTLFNNEDKWYLILILLLKNVLNGT